MVAETLGIAGLILVILAFILIPILVIAAMVFWILMLIDTIQRKFKNDNDKVMWVVIIIFAGIVGAFIYYFMVKKKGKK